ncbi:hypothetical protein D1007_16571 [Hordeum vulgare]|nr:hypothetical protein D1007_16571 [Hordeum vulgare]
MAGRRRRQRSSNKLKLKTASRSDIPSGPTGVHQIPDHLLELVLLRVGSSVALVRAAFTCKRWRRLVADTAFLARFRSLHPAHVPGHYHVVDRPYREKPRPDGKNQVFVPDPLSSTADAIDGRHFSLDFLPECDASSAWELADSRGSLLLLYKTRSDWTRQLRFPDLLVCEPLSRRCQGIAYPPAMRLHLCFGAFLLDGGAVDDTGGCIGMSNFRVIVAVYEDVAHSRGAPRACVFSSGADGGWSLGQRAAGVPLSGFGLITYVGRTRWSRYWKMERGGVVLSLDEATAEFSLVMFPDTVVGWRDEFSTFWVIGGEDGAVRVVRMINRDFTVFAQLQGSGEWVTEKVVRLRPADIVAANERYILLTPRGETCLFSVELDTLQAESTHERNRYAGPAYPYELPWPPALQACCAADDRRPRRCR